MKTRTNNSSRRLKAAFSITEVMVSMVILGIVMGGSIYTHYFGMRMFEISKAKLGASDEARSAINKMISDIRCAKIVRIGNGSLSTFTEIPVNTPLAGSAIQVHPTTNTTEFVRYFWDEGDHQLKRTTNGATSVSVVANFITNSVIFRAEDAFGNTQSNNFNNRVISMTLEFYQLQYPIVRIGPGYYYEYYRLSNKITRRALE